MRGGSLSKRNGDPRLFDLCAGKGGNRRRRGLFLGGKSQGAVKICQRKKNRHCAGLYGIYRKGSEAHRRVCGGGCHLQDCKSFARRQSDAGSLSGGGGSFGRELRRGNRRAASQSEKGRPFRYGADACRHHQRSVRRRKALRRRTKRDRRGARKNGNRNPRRSRRNDRRRTRGDVCGRGRNPHDFPQREKQTGLCGGRRPRGQVSQRKACGKIRNERSPERGKLEKEGLFPLRKETLFLLLVYLQSRNRPINTRQRPFLCPKSA